MVMANRPSLGRFTSKGSRVRAHFTDATNRGIVNFVMRDVDVITKHSAVRYWEVES